MSISSDIIHQKKYWERRESNPGLPGEKREKTERNIIALRNFNKGFLEVTVDCGESK